MVKKFCKDIPMLEHSVVSTPSTNAIITPYSQTWPSNRLGFRIPDPRCQQGQGFRHGRFWRAACDGAEVVAGSCCPRDMGCWTAQRSQGLIF